MDAGLSDTQSAAALEGPARSQATAGSVSGLRAIRTPDAQEVAELRKKLRRVTEERDILKKALAFFAEDES